MDFKAMLISIDSYNIGDDKAREKANLLDVFSDEVHDLLIKGNYGTGIQHFHIGVLISNPPETHAHFLKVYKPRFSKYKLFKSKFQGFKDFKFSNLYHYTITITKDTFISYIYTDELGSKKVLATEVFKSFKYLDKLPRSVKDFDKDKFKADIFEYCVEKGYLEKDFNMYAE